MLYHPSSTFPQAQLDFLDLEIFFSKFEVVVNIWPPPPPPIGATVENFFKMNLGISSISYNFGSGEHFEPPPPPHISQTVKKNLFFLLFFFFFF